MGTGEGYSTGRRDGRRWWYEYNSDELAAIRMDV